MLHNEARNLLVEAYEKTHDAKGIALACGVSAPSVYRLAEQKVRTGRAKAEIAVTNNEEAHISRPPLEGQEMSHQKTNYNLTEEAGPKDSGAGIFVLTQHTLCSIIGKKCWC